MKKNEGNAVSGGKNDPGAFAGAGGVPPQILLDALAASAAVLDADGTVIAINEHWRRCALENGPKINETRLGENYLAACDAAGEGHRQAGIAAGGIRGVLRGDSPSFQMEYSCGAPGEGRWMLMRAAALGGPGNGVLVTFENFTARLAAEMELRKNETLLRKIFETLPVGLWVADERGQLLFGNPAGVRIWGGEPLVGPKNYGVFKARRLPSGEEIAPDDWALSRSINEGVTVREELLEIDALDGEKRVVLNYTAPIEIDGGGVCGAIVVN